MRLTRSPPRSHPPNPARKKKPPSPVKLGPRSEIRSLIHTALRMRILISLQPTARPILRHLVRLVLVRHNIIIFIVASPPTPQPIRYNAQRAQQHRAPYATDDATNDGFRFAAQPAR